MIDSLYSTIAPVTVPLVSTSAALRVERVAYGQWPELKATWNELAAGVPFLQYEWLESWWQAYRTGRDELYLLAVKDEAGRLVGLTPWYLNTSTMNGKVLRFLGSGQVCSDYMSLLTQPGCERAVAEQVGAYLGDRKGDWDLLELEGVDAEDIAAQALAQELDRRGHHVHRRAGLNCWRVELPETWDAYLKQLSKSRRERVRQLQRRVFDTGRAVARLADSPESYQRGLEVLVDLHQKRRTSQGDRGCFASDRFSTFLREAGRRFLETDQLRLQWIELEGKPIAVEFDIAGGDTLYYYQSGIDPAAENERPGWLSVMSALRRAVEQGYRAMDFLRGDEPYKSSWRGVPRPQEELRIVPPGTSARLRHQTWLGKQQVKQWLKARLRPESNRGHSE